MDGAGLQSTDAGSNPLDFSIMTLNMDSDHKAGSGTNDERQKAIYDILIEANKPVIVFAQEIGAQDEENWGIRHTSYKYKTASGDKLKPSGIMWQKDVFTESDVIDVHMKEVAQILKVKEKLDPCKEGEEHRICAALLKHSSKAFNILAASWHGPHLNRTGEEKVKVFQNLQKFILALKKEIENEEKSGENEKIKIAGVIIGGDFNLNFESDKSDLRSYLEEDFGFCPLEDQETRKPRKLVDQFLFTNSLHLIERPKTFTEEQLTRLDFKRVLDHDPVMAKVSVRIKDDKKESKSEDIDREIEDITKKYQEMGLKEGKTKEQGQQDVEEPKEKQN